MGNLKNIFFNKWRKDHKNDSPTQQKKDPDLSQNAPPTNHATQEMKPGAPTNPSYPSSKHAHKQNNGAQAPSKQKAKHPGNADQTIPNRQIDLIKQQEKERHEKKLLRRQIHSALEDLRSKGSACTVNDIVAFIQNFSNKRDILKEVLIQFGDKDAFPNNMIWLSISHSGDSTPDALLQALEAHKQRSALIQQRDRLATLLPSPLVISVPTTEDGPQLASLTADQIHTWIQEQCKETLSPFTISAPLPFLQQGDYALLLDFSQGITISLTLRLQAVPDVLPAECVQDFTGIQPLPLANSVEVHAFLQKHLTDVQPSDLKSRCSLLSVVLVTAYHAGYGKTSWAREYLQEWRSKRREYQDCIAKEIRAAIERINHEVPWLLPETREGETITIEALHSYVEMRRQQDPTLSLYQIEIDVETRGEDGYKQPYYSAVISWQNTPLGSVQLQRTPKRPVITNTREDQEIESKKPTQKLERLFTRTTSASSSLPQASSTLRALQDFVKTLKQDLLEANPQAAGRFLPATVPDLLDEIKIYRENRERADAYLSLARIYDEQDNEVLLRFALAGYCFWHGWQLIYNKDTRLETRSYLLGFFSLYNQMKPEHQARLVREYYRSLALYFDTYGFYIDIRDTLQNELDRRFYSNLFLALSKAREEKHEALGNCVVELYTICTRFFPDLIERLKTFPNTDAVTTTIIIALQEEKVLRKEMIVCLYLLNRLDPAIIANILHRQISTILNQRHLPTADERRQVVNALLPIASATKGPTPSMLLSEVVTKASNAIRAMVAFSLLVEPFMLNNPEQEKELKARFIAEALGLPSGNQDTEFFLGIAAELSLLFDRFFNSPNPNVKGGLADIIEEKMQVMKRRVIDGLRENQKREIVQAFFQDTEQHVKHERAKLIRDTTLELKLVSDRTLYSARRTRITVEIHNSGEGVAYRLVLEISEVKNQYKVADRDRLHKIDILEGNTSLQKELFIQPLVSSNQSIELSLTLRYDTIKGENKEALLPPSDRMVRFYDADQFVDVKQPYSISAPAETRFYGRKDLLERMADNLDTATEHDSSMIVYGMKRAGKTSVVKRFIAHTLRNRGLDQTHIPIYADLQKHPKSYLLHTDHDFLFFLIDIIRDEIAVKRQIALPFNQVQMEQQFRRDPYTGFSICLEQLLSVLGGRRLLLVLDEFSVLYEDVLRPSADRGLTPKLFSTLSNITQGTHQLTFIFTGTYMLLDMMREHMYDLAKICTPRMISFLDDVSARQLITEPVQQDPQNPDKGWLEYDERVVDLIVDYTNCHPYLIQCVCQLLVERMNNLRDQQVNLNDLDKVVLDITIEPTKETMMLNLWKELDLAEQKVLSVVASWSNVNQSWVETGEIIRRFREAGEIISQEEIETICGNLAVAGLLKKNRSAEEQSEAYQITIPLYRMWIKQSKPIRSILGRRSMHSPS